MKTESDTPASHIKIEQERTHFKLLLASNPNYFGNLEKSQFPPVKEILSNTTYETLHCVGYHQDRDLLEATVHLNRPSGYNGSLCQAGSTEYVRFYIDYGHGWLDLGISSFNAHDIPNSLDCAKQATKPLVYVVSLTVDPKRAICKTPVLPLVRAILSWETPPPANTPNWPPVWGNVLDRHVQIKPRRPYIKDIYDDISATLGKAVKVPPLFEEVQLVPIPLPDPAPDALPLETLVKLYGGASEKGARATDAKFTVEPHRFALPHLQSALAAGGIDQNGIVANIATWQKLGLDWQAALAALDQTKADVSFEELLCLGLDYNREWLVATVEIKKPSGYSGSLCDPGSYEYVAFWVDWNDTCDWTYAGTVAVNVHDFVPMAKGGLHYAAILPVDLSAVRQPCENPKVARVRAVLSWSVPPSTTNPDELKYWGNRLDAHVQLKPGKPIGEPGAVIRALGGIPIENIDTAGDGLTTMFGAIPAKFWYNDAPADAWGLNRDCPFGGSVLVHGQWFLGYKYRIRARQVSNPSNVVTLLTPFNITRWTPGYDTQAPDSTNPADPGYGFFTYANPALYMENSTLGVWSTSTDDLWEVQLDIANSMYAILDSTPWYRIQLDNTAPGVDIHIDNGGDCNGFDKTDTIDGHFVARDLYFGGFSLGTLPNTVAIPSNQPSTAWTASNQTPVAPGAAWELNLHSPIAMKPCGYVVQLVAYDRAIIGSQSGSHNGNHIETGFYILP
jgi:hypothetical protein